MLIAYAKVDMQDVVLSERELVLAVELQQERRQRLEAVAALSKAELRIADLEAEIERLTHAQVIPNFLAKHWHQEVKPC